MNGDPGIFKDVTKHDTAIQENLQQKQLISLLSWVFSAVTVCCASVNECAKSRSEKNNSEISLPVIYSH